MAMRHYPLFIGNTSINGGCSTVIFSLPEERLISLYFFPCCGGNVSGVQYPGVPSHEILLLN